MWIPSSNHNSVMCRTRLCRAGLVVTFKRAVASMNATLLQKTVKVSPDPCCNSRKWKLLRVLFSVGTALCGFEVRLDELDELSPWYVTDILSRLTCYPVLLESFQWKQTKEFCWMVGQGYATPPVVFSTFHRETAVSIDTLGGSGYSTLYRRTNESQKSKNFFSVSSRCFQGRSRVRLRFIGFHSLVANIVCQSVGNR